MGNVGEKEKDTTYRLTRTTGFNARVEPIWMHFDKTKDQRGMLGSFLEKRRVKGIISAIHDHLAAQRAAASDWDRDEGECVGNMKIAKMGLLQELRDAVGRRIPPRKMPQIEHFTRVRESNSFCIPVDFPQPFEVPGATSKEVIPICSSVRLAKELELVGEMLGVARKMNPAKMVPFMLMKEDDVAKADQKALSDVTFWPSFTFCILKKLADLSVEKNLPIVFA